MKKTKSARAAAVLFIFSILHGATFQAKALVQGRAGSTQKMSYYGEDFYKDLASHAENDQLKQSLRTVLQGAHIVTQGTYDRITQNCGAEKGCYQHKSIGYNSARVFLLGNYYLVKSGNSYGVREVYCQKEYMSNDFPPGGAPGPKLVPSDRVVNVEHTWPQSRFTGKFPTDMQKSDLHHLYPADSRVNGIRGNYPFGEVARPTKEISCPSGAAFGNPERGKIEVFEPPRAHKGHVARALFYFSLKYEMPIDPDQEANLRRWNTEEPVDAEEADRNEKIYQLQGSRNPFVDYPELADQIRDF